MARPNIVVQIKFYDDDMVLVDEIKKLASKANITMSALMIILLRAGLVAKKGEEK